MSILFYLVSAAVAVAFMALTMVFNKYDFRGITFGEMILRLLVCFIPGINVLTAFICAILVIGYVLLEILEIPAVDRFLHRSPFKKNL